MNIALPDQLEELTRNHEAYPSALMGEDKDGNIVLVTVQRDKVIVERHTHGDAVCVQTWWPNGQVDELFENRFAE